MAKFYPALTEPLMDFIREQHLFFTASASASGRVNLSPKGLQTFSILSPTRVAYLDLTGSGIETAAHLQSDGRLTLMFCSLEDAPLILRLYGRGSVLRPEGADWDRLYRLFPPIPGARQIIILDIDSVQTSCGFGVPRYSYCGERDTLVQWAMQKGSVGLRQYRAEKNRLSIDGFPSGLKE